MTTVRSRGGGDGATARVSCPPMKAAAVLAVTLCACSSLDPSVGPWRIGQPVTDGGADAPGECSEVGTDEVCFARDIRPILMRTRDQAVAAGSPRGCVPCHLRASMGQGALLGGLDVSTLGEIRQGGGSTRDKIIVAGRPDESLMVRALRGQFGSNRMPKGSMPAQFWSDSSEEMRLLTTWIAEGARGRDGE